MHVILIGVDRRTDCLEAVLSELASIEASVPGLSVDRRDRWEDFPDAGRFRDFVPVALARHSDARVLEWLAEELVECFGWKVDIRQP